MAASITHLLIGELLLHSVFSDQDLESRGAFLLGCILIDIHAFNQLDRKVAHFVRNAEDAGESAWTSSCSIFLRQLDDLLIRPWVELRREEQAFTAGYLCHLSVDEVWKKRGWQLFRDYRIQSWADFPIPGDVSLTTNDFLCSKKILDLTSLMSAMDAAKIPDIFRHLPLVLLKRQWDIIREYVRDGGTPDAHIQMLMRAGKPREEILQAQLRYRDDWEKSLEFVQQNGGVDPFIQEAFNTSKNIMPALKNRH